MAWAYANDVAAPGSKHRRRRVRSGFATKAEALASLRDAQQADATGRLRSSTGLDAVPSLIEHLSDGRMDPLAIGRMEEGNPDKEC